MKRIFLVMCLYSVCGLAQEKVAETKVESLNDLQFFGDFRYRHQTETVGPKDTRMIQRLQARFGVTSTLQENLKVTLRLMTGSAANSGNQTLGDEKAPGMQRRSFGLDQAFFEYKPMTSVSVYGGKMPQVFTFAGKNQMILDRDITLEGMAFKSTVPVDEAWELFIQGGSFWIRENYDSLYGQDLTDNMLNAAQLGARWKFEEGSVLFGLGSFSYIDLKNNPPANVAIGTTGANGNGNTLDVNGNYTTNYDITEYFVEVQKKWGTLNVTAFFEALQNGDVSDYNKATVYGVLLNHGSWSLGWTRQEVQKDAVVAAFTDSDFAGGVTSSRGHVYTVIYKATKKVQVQYTVYKNETSIDLVSANYDRSHLDLLMTF